MSAKKNSFHAWIKTNSAAVRIPGAASGRITLYNACSRLQALYKVILPLAAPGILTAALLVFIHAWNEFFFALIVMTDPNEIGRASCREIVYISCVAGE